MKQNKEMTGKIKDIIRQGEKFLVASHRDPDGDAIGSSLAIAGYLMSLNKDIFVYNRHPVPENLLFLRHSELFSNKIEAGSSFDVTFILDCSEYPRISDDFSSLEPRLGRIINIDHHKTSKGLGEINVIDPGASSTAELIFNVFKEMGVNIDENIATSLYAALLTDTGSFRYSNSSPLAFAMASELVAMGAKPWDVAQNYYENIPVPKLKLTALVLSTLEIYEDEKFASLTLSREMMESSRAKPEFSDGLINYPRSLRGIEVAILFKEVSKTEYKISLRSKGEVDVTQIALSFGGGGHKNAAGCAIKGDLNTVKRKIYERAGETIKKHIGDPSSK